MTRAILAISFYSYFFLGVFGLLAGGLLLLISALNRKKLAAWLWMFLIFLGVFLVAAAIIWMCCIGFFMS